jgi:hypothetical protein
MRSARILVVLACAFAGGCTPQLVAQQSDIPQLLNPPISVALTCAEFLPLIHSHDKIVGPAILWLDGYYSGRAGLTGMRADWLKTISQGVGGTCAIDVNASRPVIDVIAQLHREYGDVMSTKP